MAGEQPTTPLAAWLAQLRGELVTDAVTLALRHRKGVQIVLRMKADRTVQQPKFNIGD